MTPNIPLPTDNIYKFLSLFGLFLVAIAVFSYASIYSNYLGEIKKSHTENKTIQSKVDITKQDKEILAINEEHIKIINDNNKISINILVCVFIFGFIVSVASITHWFSVIQKRDDNLVEIQIKRIGLENIKLELDAEKIKLETERLAIELGRLRGPQ